MSDDIRTGSKARKIMTVMAAVLAVAMMLAVPVLTASGSDAASFTAGDAGMCITATNASDSDLEKYGFSDKANTIVFNGGTRMFSKIFKLTLLDFGTPTVTADSLTVKNYGALKIESDRTEEYDGKEMTAEKVVITYTASKATELLIDDFDYYGDDYEAAGNAIKAYLGNEVSAGDKIVIKGDIKARTASKEIANFAEVDSTKNVVKDGKAINYFLYQTDVTIEFTHGGETKSITFYSDQKFEVDRDSEFDYKGKAYTDLKDSDKCDITYKDTYYFESGSSYYKVDGEKYKLDNLLTPASPEENQPVEFCTDSDAQTVLTAMKVAIDLIPAGTSTVTVEKTYESGESAFTSLASDVALDDILAVILLIVGIVVGIIVIIVILIIVLVVLKKKKK